MLRVFFRVFLVWLVIFAAVFAFYYFRINAEKEALAMESGTAIEEVLEKNLFLLEEVFVLIGEEIARSNPNLDLQKIHQIFVRHAAEKKYPDILSWTKFDWVNVDGYQTVNTLLGVRLKKAPRMTDRNYRNHGNTMWAMIFSQAAIGKPSGAHIIPIGVQISTAKIAQAGTVTGGIDIEKLLQLVLQNLPRNVDFAVIDKRDSSVVFSSERKEWGSKISSKKKYFYSEKLAGRNPYIIKVGYGKSDIFRVVIKKSVILTLELAVLLGLFVLLGRVIKSTNLN